jgi:hypothetical protein
VSQTLFELFPLLVVIGVLIVVVGALRLDRRMSRGAYSAGPTEVPRPDPAGQAAVPWELRAIEDQLRMASAQSSQAVPRYDLTATVNRLLTAAGLTDPRHQLPVTATEAELAAAVTKIEQQLGLPPLHGGTDPRHSRRGANR